MVKVVNLEPVAVIDYLEEIGVMTYRTTAEAVDVEALSQLAKELCEHVMAMGPADQRRIVVQRHHAIEIVGDVLPQGSGKWGVLDLTDGGRIDIYVADFR